MSDKLIWSSNMTKDYINGLSDEEKKNMLLDRGYDPEMLDDVNSAIDQDDYMWQDDSDDFINNVVPMINKQTHQGKIICVNADDKNADAIVCTVEDLNSGDICPEASDVAIHDTGDGIEVNYYDKNGQNILTLIPYAIPEDKAEQEEFIKNVMPGFGDGDDIVDQDDFSEEDELNDFVNKDQLKVHGKRIKNELHEDYEEPKLEFPEEEDIKVPEFNEEEFEESLSTGSKLYKDIFGEELSRVDAEELEPELDAIYDDLFTFAQEADQSSASETADVAQKAMDVIDDKSEVINEEEEIKEESNMDKLKAYYGPKFDEKLEEGKDCEEPFEECGDKLEEANQDYLVVPGDMAIAKELGESEDLDEALPKPLAKAYKGAWEGRRDHNAGELGPEGNYKGLGRNRGTVMTDFANSDYQEITPEEAYNLFKAEQSRNVHVVIDGKLANVYIATDPVTGKKKTTYDFKCRGNFVKDNGKEVENSAWLTPKELYARADKIYLVNETPMDQALLAKRAENPESGKKFAKGAYNRIKPELKSIPYSVKDKIKRNQIKIDSKSGKGMYRTDSSYMQMAKDDNGNFMQPGEWYTADEFKRLRDVWKARWSDTDADVLAANYIIDGLEGRSPTGKSPLDYDWRYYNNRKDNMANLRYKDLETSIQSAMKAGREITDQISSLNRGLQRTQDSRTRLADPARLASRKEQLQDEIDSWQRNINYYMKQLLMAQDKLDDVDITNQKEIEELDKQIANTMDKIDELRSKMKGLFKR